jgi:hypothetical protein
LKSSKSGHLSKLPLLKIAQSLLIVGITLGVALMLYSSPLYNYEFGLSASGADPNVKFIHWADGRLSNTISLNYDVYADVTTYDSNSTYGIANTATNQLGIGLRIESISNTAELANLTLTILSHDGTQQMAKISWVGGNALPTPLQTFTASPQTNYLIRINIKGSNSVVVGESTNIILQISSSR